MMNTKLSIQLKAATLLTIFSLNTLIGFACSVGIDMGFNKTHHHEEETTEIHVHKDGKLHDHAKKEHTHSHKSGKDDCCNDDVTKIAQGDKTVPQMAVSIDPVFIAVFVAGYFDINITCASQVSTSNKYFVLGHHPPIPDIRIAIQSFQI